MRANRRQTTIERWENEGGAPQGHRRATRGRPFTLSRTKPALYYFDVRTEQGVLDDDPEGLTLTDLKAALDQALTLARDSLAEGDRRGENRRGWRIEVKDRARQRLLTVEFAAATPTAVLFHPD
jgi:hypothetical protein